MRFLLFIFLSIFFNYQAHAACTDPDGVPGELMYNDTYDVFQGCTMRGWMAFGLTRSSALARTNLLGEHSGSTYGTDPYISSSFIPPANSLLVAAVLAMETSGTTDPSGDLTIDGGGLTWTSRAIVGNPNSYSLGMRVWTAPVGANPLPIQLTFDGGSRNIYDYFITVLAYTGYDATNPVGTTGTGGGSGANGLGRDGPASFNLAAAPAANSEVIAFLGIDKSARGASRVDPGDGWAELYDFVQLPPNNYTGMQAQVRGGTTNPGVNWNDLHAGNGGVAKTIGAAIEIRAHSW